MSRHATVWSTRCQSGFASRRELPALAALVVGLLVPEHQFGGFVAAVPPPLTIGTVVLEDRVSVKGFLCESAAVSESVDITHFGGWVNYLQSQRPVGA